jgi:putative sugar O-methyltransferase
MLRVLSRDYLRRKFRKTRATWQRYRDRRLFTHPTFTHALIDALKPDVVLSRAETALDSTLIQRVAACYGRSSRDAAGTSPSMWDQLQTRRGDFIAALQAADAPAIGSFVNTMFRFDLLEGMGHAEALFLDEENNPYTKDYFRLRVSDCVLSLAEALALHPAPSYAQMRLPDYIEHLRVDQNALFARIEASLGFSLAAPDVGMPPGCRLNGTFTTPDLLRHAYTVHRLRSLGYGPDSRILEIGGGFGAAALLAFRAGFRRYTIIDLPFVGAIQMLYLGHALGRDKVAGAGEASAAISLLPPSAIRAVPDKSIDLVVNTDSLPEIGHGTALEYMQQIKRITRAFLSINQEAQKHHPGVGKQNLVPALAEASGGYLRRHRFRHWMEQGYVEEYYEIGA